MALIVSSTSAATLEGAYGILRAPPTTIRPIGTGIACLVEKQSWGPGQVVTTPSDVADMLLTFAPPGMDRTNVGYLAMQAKAFPQLRILRVTGSTSPTKAFVALTSAGPVTVLTLTLNSYGSEGNSVTAVVSAATDGDSNHFDLVISVTGTSGTTTDTLRNFNASASGTHSAPDFTKLRLLGAVTFGTNGRPDNGTYTFASGADGTPGAADYDGTIGTGDKGLAKTEGMGDINHIFFGDPGNSIRATVNAAMLAHVESLKSRMGYINGNSGLTATQAQTDVANYRSIFLQYVDVWPYINRDVDAAKTITAPAPFAASVASQLPPSAHISWRDPKVQAMLANIVDLEAERGANAYNNKLAGIVTLQRKRTGGFCFEGDVNTYNATDPSVGGAYRTRVAIYLLESMLESVQSKIDGPNVEATQQPIIDAASKFLGDLVENSKIDPENLPYLKDAGIDDVKAFNPDGSIRNGDFTVPCSAQTDPGMQRIFFNLNVGDSVTVKPNSPTF